MSKKRSNIWLHFSEVPGKSLAQCITCQAQLSRKGGSVNNLSHHMKTKHPTMALECQTKFVNENENEIHKIESVCDELDSIGVQLASTSSNSTNNQLATPGLKPALTRPAANIRQFCVSMKPLSMSMTK